MLGRRPRRDPPATAPSPWSSEANAPGAPPLTWEAPPAEFGPAGHDGASDGPAGRSATWLVVGAVAIAAVGGLVWLWPDGEDVADAPAADATPTTLGTLPPSGDDEFDSRDGADADADGSDTDDADGTNGSGTSDSDASGGPATSGDPGVEAGGETSDRAADESVGEVVRPSAPSVRSVELPDGLPEFEQPFEIVLTTEHGIATLSLPSGTLRTVPVPALDGFEPAGALAVGPDVSMLLTSEGATFVDRAGGLRAIGPEALDGGATVLGSGVQDGATRFVLAQWDEQGAAEIVVVGPEAEPATVGPLPSFPAFTAPDGEVVVGDAGGVYRLDASGGGTRISDGSLLGHGSGRVLVRECDPDYRCGLATIGLDTGERVEFDGIDDESLPSHLRWNQGAAVSPDGRAVVATVQDPLGGDPTDLLVVADGTSRTVVQDGIGFGWPSQVAWAPDSSGWFRPIPPAGRSSGSALRFTGLDGTSIDIEGLPASDLLWIGLRTVEEELPADSGTPTIEPLPDAGVGLVGVDGAAAVHLDLRDGSVTTWEVPDAGPDPDVFFVDGNVIVVSSRGDLAYRTALGSLLDERRAADGGIDGPRFEGTDDRLIWQPAAGPDGYELVPVPFHDIGGREPWKTSPASRDDVYGTNGSGGLVVRDGGDIVVVDGAGSRLLATGELVAIGRGGALVHACDEGDVCGNVRIDADGVASAAIAGPPGAAEPVAPGEPIGGTVSPDGDAMYLRIGTDRTDGDTTDDGSSFAGSSAAFVDWATTSTVPAPELDPGTTVSWTEDSRFAFFLADGRIHLFDRDASSVRTLALGRFDGIVLVDEDFDA